MKSRPREKPHAGRLGEVEWPLSAQTLKRVEVLWLDHEPPPADVEEAFTIVRPNDLQLPPPRHQMPDVPSPELLAGEQTPRLAEVSPPSSTSIADPELDAVPAAEPPVELPEAAETSSSFFISRRLSPADAEAAAVRPRTSSGRDFRASAPAARVPTPGPEPFLIRHPSFVIRHSRWPVYAGAAGAVAAMLLIALPAFWRSDGDSPPAGTPLGTTVAESRSEAPPAAPETRAGQPAEPEDAPVPVSESSPAASNDAGPANDAAPDEPPATPSNAARVETVEPPARREAPRTAPLPVPAPASQVSSPLEVGGSRSPIGTTGFDVETVGGIPPAPPARVAGSPATAAGGRPEADRPAVETTSTASMRPASTPAETSASAEQGVRAVLSRYRSGYEELDVGMVREAWPGVDTQALARAFSGLSSQDLVFDRCEILVRGEAARARCAGSTTYIRRVGSRAPRTVALTWAFDLARSGDHWTITNAAVR